MIKRILIQLSENKNLRRLLKIELYLFSLFIVGIVIDTSYSIIAEQKNYQEIIPPLLRYIKVFYLPLALSTLTVYCLVWFITPLRLYFYYYIWIRLIFGKLQRAQSTQAGLQSKISNFLLKNYFNEQYDSYVLESFHENIGLVETDADKLQEMSYYKNRPAIVREEHLMEKDFWRNWAFAVLLLFNKIEIHRFRVKKRIEFRLTINLLKQSHAIYNNAGKLAIRKIFNKTSKEKRLEISENIHTFLKSTEPTECHMVIDPFDVKTPLRWASGGVLPITKWKNRLWYVLIFRDIPPVGWNICCGASQSKQEYIDVCGIGYREFLEELVLLNSKPDPLNRFPIQHKKFKVLGLPANAANEIQKLNREFAELHKELRSSHDKMTITPEEGPAIDLVNTPFKVKIAYYDEELRSETSTEPIGKIIFNINPCESGIEVLLLASFDMEDNDYLMCGEIWEPAKSLCRQPIMLLSCDYIQKIYQKNKTLGKPYNNNSSLNCKKLEGLPYRDPPAYEIFDQDIEFLKRRLQELKAIKNIQGKELLELDRYLSRLEYVNLFESIKESNRIDNNDEYRPLLMLCPVTWKAMELTCHYNLLKDLQSTL